MKIKQKMSEQCNTQYTSTDIVSNTKYASFKTTTIPKLPVGNLQNKSLKYHPKKEVKVHDRNALVSKQKKILIFYSRYQ
jgi:hypothetical protein